MKFRALTSLSAALLVAACGSSSPTGAPAAAPTASASAAATIATAAPTATTTAAPLPAINGEHVSFPNGDLKLGGPLWKPAGNGPFRAVLWNHGSEELPGSPKAAIVPFLFTQAENDFSLVATQALADAIKADGGTATRAIYPAFGTTAQDGHEFAVRGSDIWGAEVYAFLASAFGG